MPLLKEELPVTARTRRHRLEDQVIGRLSATEKKTLLRLMQKIYL